MDANTPLGLYNSIVDITKKTGQGVPLFVVERLGLVEAADIMVEKGILNKYHQQYSHLPDDTTYCINGVYNVENDMGESKGKGVFMSSSLHFIRRWLNLDQSQDILFKIVKDKTGDDVYKQWLIDSKPEYLNWIKKNLEGIEALNKLEHLTHLDLTTGTSLEVGTESYELLVSRIWFTDNEKVSECIRLNDEAMDVIKQQIRLTKEILSLYSKKSNNADDAEVKRHNLFLAETSKELDIRKGWYTTMILADDAELIQNVFKF